MILKSKFGVKMKARNFACLTTFISVFPRMMLGSGEERKKKRKKLGGGGGGSGCRIVLEVENIKPFSDTHF